MKKISFKSKDVKSINGMNNDNNVSEKNRVFKNCIFKNKIKVNEFAANNKNSRKTIPLGNKRG